MTQTKRDCLCCKKNSRRTFQEPVRNGATFFAGTALTALMRTGVPITKRIGPLTRIFGTAFAVITADLDRSSINSACVAGRLN